MIDARDQVHVLLTSESRDSSSRYEVVIGSMANNVSVLKRIENNKTEEMMRRSIIGHLKENETRSFWIEVENERVMFGSGEQVRAIFRAIYVTSRRNCCYHLMFHFTLMLTCVATLLFVD